MSNLATAIEILEAEVAAFNHGTQAAPSIGSAEWFVLRAKALAVSHLKRIRQLGLDNDQTGRAVEEHYRGASRLVKGESLAALLSKESVDASAPS